MNPTKIQRYWKIIVSAMFYPVITLFLFSVLNDAVTSPIAGIMFSAALYNFLHVAEEIA